jgi:uncharacterized OsmC-like protein
MTISCALISHRASSSGRNFVMTNPTGLDVYLSNKAAAMASAARALESGDAARDTIAAECTASDVTGVRRVQMREFRVLSDSGPAFGGFGLGPSSPELLLGVLASCLTHTYLIGAARQGVSLDRVHVRFEAENNDAEFLGLSTADPPYPANIRAFVTLDGAAKPEDLEALHAYAARSCPLTRLVREPLPVAIHVVR